MNVLKVVSAEQRDAEAVVDGFRQDRGPFVVAAETTRMPMVFTDAKVAGNPIIFANDAFLKLTGYERTEVLAQGFSSLMGPGSTLEALASVKAAFDGSCESDTVISYRRKDQSSFWASVLVSPVRNPSGNVVQHFISLVDLTKQKEEQLLAHMLVEELNHRVKNTLQAVQSIVGEGFRNRSDPAAVRASIDARIRALSRAHDLLMSTDWDGAGLHELIRTAFEPFTDAAGQDERIELTGANIHLAPRATLTLGVVFHELAMNAVKYGALSTDAGSVTVAWSEKTTPDGPRLVIEWREKGGPPVSTPTRKGFGSRFIERGLAHELAGTATLDFRAEGVACTIDIPMPMPVPAASTGSDKSLPPLLGVRA